MHHAPSPPTRWRAQAFEAVKGLLGLIWAFAPEIVATFFGLIIGLVGGIVSGAALSSSLFEEGGGSWGHAGLLAVLLPALAFLGPVFVGVFFGGIIIPSITLAVHAMVILIASKDRMATRRLVVLTCALGVFGPALAFGLSSETFLSGAVMGLFFFPVTGPFGVMAGAAFCGVRASLSGRSVGQWWRDADGSMGVAMLTTSIVVWLGTWLPLLLFVAFPVVVTGLPIAIILGARLLVAGNRRGAVSVVLIINLLHSLLFGWAFVNMAFGPGNHLDDSALVDEADGDGDGDAAGRPSHDSM